ncbi:ABC transporter permease [Arthrobacter agilis]|uniref:ABC transporter permease n=1 Tax=Arthrobacter agilis TaxID=37921 RepID=UPI002788E74A|nr:ABC transporter permease [Arthrobacter agilis]MDQ0733675.1 simple sugar transport system permease protein [Arthrobacter agilis]
MSLDQKNAEAATLGRLNAQLDQSLGSFLATIRRERGITRMLVLLLLSFGLFALLKPAVFLNPLNLENIAIASPEIGILAVAMMLAMVTGGIDLSIVAIANFAAVTITTVYSGIAAQDPGQAAALMPLIVLLGLVTAAVAGLFNGFLIGVVGITPILATLGTMQILNGIAVVWTNGQTLYGAPEALTAFAKTTVVGIPALFLFFLLIAVAIAILMNRTSLGLKLQLQGANALAAKYSGISSRRVLMSTYLVSGLLGGLAGVVFIARNPTASADYGSSYVLLVIVIAVLGGTNPSGGFATVAGVVMATLTLQIVSSGFNALRLSPYEYSIAQGVILIAVMVFDQLRFRRSKPPKSRADTAPVTP